MTPLLLALALVGASPRTADAALWDAAFALTDPAQVSQAEATLTKAGPAGFAVLMKMARSGGEAAALQAAAHDLRCPTGLSGNPMPQMMMRSQNPEPFQAAARFVSKLLTNNPKLRERMHSSPSSFERRFVLANLAREPKALLEALPRLDKEKDPQVLTLAREAMQCIRFGFGGKEPVDRKAALAAQKSLEQRLTELLPQDHCDSPEGITGELREGLRKGSWWIAGWGSSDRDLHINVDTGKNVMLRLSSTCALALYDALAQQGVFLHGLVLPLSTFPRLPKETRQEAARRATRDLEHYPEQERNRLAVELVNAGHTVQQPVVLREEDFLNAEELEAAARQKQPGALKAIEQHIFCRGTMGDSSVALLGYERAGGASAASGLATQTQVQTHTYWVAGGYLPETLAVRTFDDFRRHRAPGERLVPEAEYLERLVDPVNTTQLFRLDADLALESVYAFPPGWLMGAPVWVPRAGGTTMKDGWLVGCVWGPSDPHVEIWIFDGQQPLSAGPLSKLVPAPGERGLRPGFPLHGSWVDRTGIDAWARPELRTALVDLPLYVKIAETGVMAGGFLRRALQQLLER